MTIVVAAIHPALAIAAAWPLGCAALVALICALLLWRAHDRKGDRKGDGKSQGKAIEINNPFGLGPALKLAALLAVVQVLAPLSSKIAMGRRACRSWLPLPAWWMSMPSP